jgi:DNA-binding transcriptional LysR family regulator
MDAALDELNVFRERPAGTLRINTSRAALRLVLIPIVARFVAEHPDVHVELISEEALVDVVSAGFDAGVRFGETIAADMVATPIGPRQAFAVVGTPAFFELHPVPRTPHELRALPCVRLRFASGTLYRWEFEQHGKELTVEVGGSLTLSDIDLMLDAALSGVGLVYAFEHAARALIASGAFVRVLEDWCPLYAGSYLYYPSREQQPAVLRASWSSCAPDNPTRPS